MARWQASVLAAIYVDFTSGLREITLVGPAIGQNGGEESRKRTQDTGQDEPCQGGSWERGRGEGLLPLGLVGVVCAGISCHHFASQLQINLHNLSAARKMLSSVHRRI